MSDFREAIKKNINGVTLNLFVNYNSNISAFPAGYDKWRKRILIKVCSPARENKANNEVIKKILNFFHKKPSEVFMILGHQSKEKTVLIKNIKIEKIIDIFEESFNGL